MARKTAVRITRQELDAEEMRKQRRRDRAAMRRAGARMTLLPTIEEMRARRGTMTEHELLKRCRDAARLELRGASYSAEDRADVAATIAARLIADRDFPARADSARLSLTRCCGMAANLRRSIDSTRERDRIDAEARAAEYAASPAALGLGADIMPADHAHIVARSSVKLAERAADAVCELLSLPAEHDAPHWSIFYQWTRAESGEICAAEQGVTYAAWRVRATRGAKFVRGFYSAADLIGRLVLGAAERNVGTAAEPVTELVLVTRDDSRTAHGRTPLLAAVAHAPHWRESQPAETPITRSRLSGKDRAHWRKHRARRADHTQQVADALTRAAREHARTSRRRERAVSARSDLRR